MLLDQQDFLRQYLIAIGFEILNILNDIPQTRRFDIIEKAERALSSNQEVEILEVKTIARLWKEQMKIEELKKAKNEMKKSQKAAKEPKKDKKSQRDRDLTEMNVEKTAHHEAPYDLRNSNKQAHAKNEQGNFASIQVENDMDGFQLINNSSTSEMDTEDIENANTPLENLGSLHKKLTVYVSKITVA